VVGLEGFRAEIAMVERPPDGHDRLELVNSTPPRSGRDGHAPANTPGIRHLTFAADDLDAAAATVRARGGELVGEVENTKTSIGSATSAARRGSSSSWRSGSAEVSGATRMDTRCVVDDAPDE
jgi:hypothetical protein